MGSVGRERRGVSRLWYPYRGACEVESRLDMSRLYLSLWDDNPTIHLISCPSLAGGGGDPYMGLFTGFDVIDRDSTNTRQ